MVLAAALVLNVQLGADALTSDFGFTNDAQSQTARDLVEERFGTSFQEVLVVKSETLVVEDEAFRQRVESAYDLIVESGGIEPIQPHFYLTGDEQFVSGDRRTLIVPFSITGELDAAIEIVEPVLEEVIALNGQGGFFVAMVGEISFAIESNELSVSDIEQGEQVGVPMALVILLFLFGAVVAALVPLFLAIVSIIVALGMVAVIGQFFELVFFVTLMISMIGLAVGIDYSLIVVSRFREELGKGRNKLEAIEVAGATASRTVLFSGLTVVLALTGMLIVPATIFQSLGLGAILVVVAAVLAALTLLPAALALMGTKVNALRIPFVGRKLSQGSASDSAGGFWGTVTNVVMSYPVLALLIFGGLMAAAAYPVRDLETGFNGVDVLPDRLQTKQAFLVLEKEFSFGVAAPVDIVVDGDASDPAVMGVVQELRASLAEDPDFIGFSTVSISESGDLTILSVPVAGETSSERAVSAVRRLRDDIVPAAFAGVPAVGYVGGSTSQNIDFFDITDRFTPIVFVFVLGLSFILLTVAFRSIVIPLKSIILNLLS
ncbi:MAG: MMPL family transporter, partial [Dehalococcoidia bacterium]